VTINNILPGSFDTDRLRGNMALRAKSADKPIEEIARSMQQANPSGRFGTPAEFGALCAYLCSVQAAYITGQNLLIDGGAFPGTF